MTYQMSLWVMTALAVLAGLMIALISWLRYLWHDPFPYIDGPPSTNLIFGHVRFDDRPFLCKR
jgi:hypothetical protein